METRWNVQLYNADRTHGQRRDILKRHQFHYQSNFGVFLSAVLLFM
jgi:hypothetical protein